MFASHNLIQSLETAQLSCQLNYGFNISDFVTEFSSDDLGLLDDACFPTDVNFGPDDLFPDLLSYESLQPLHESHLEETQFSPSVMSPNVMSPFGETQFSPSVMSPHSGTESTPFLSPNSIFSEIENFSQLDLNTPLHSSTDTSPCHESFVSTLDSPGISPQLDWDYLLEADLSAGEPSVESEMGGANPTKKRKTTSRNARYLRKKQQNKEAAARYRLKKKQEDMERMDSLETAEERNREIKQENRKIRQEIKFMKKFVLEVLEKRGSST